MPIQELQTLLIVSMATRVTMREIAERLDMSQPTAWRNVQALTDKPRPDGTRGPGLVEEAYDPAETRRKIAYLTPKGKRFMGELVVALGGTDSQS